MNADSFFTTGKTHVVCQDYTRHGIAEDGTPYAILADGCSTTPDTDIGARLLVRAAEFDLKRNVTLDGRVVIARAWAYASALGLHPRCLNATLLALWVEGGRVRSQMCGDGYVVGRRRAGGALDIFKAEYPSGAPLYLNYLMDRKARASYEAEFGKPERLLTLREGAEAEDPFPTGDSTSYETFDDSDCWWEARDYDMVAVFSDGAGTFVKAQDGGQPVPVPAHEVIALAFDIQPPTGVFMARSGKWLTTKWCADNKAFHNDDFSVAAINIGAWEAPKE